MQAQGSVLTNKYAEGYPGRRYYGGCEHVDVDRAAGHRPGQGAVRRRVRQRAAALGRAGQRGGDGRAAAARRHDPRARPGPRRPPHPRHAAQLLRQALRRRRLPRARATTTWSTWPRSSGWPTSTGPKLIIAGWSAYPRQLDFAEFRRIADEVGAYLMVDMAHFAGLVAAGPAPLPRAARARRHLDHAQDPRRPARRRHPRPTPSLAKKINSAVFPGQQGGPLEHVIAAKAVAFKLAAEPAFRERQERTLDGARILADRLLRRRLPRRPGSAWSPAAPTCTWCWSTCATPTLDGKQAEDRLHARRHHGQPQRRAVRPAPADGQLRASGSAPRRWPPAASTPTTSPRSPTSSPRRCGPTPTTTELGRAARPASTAPRRTASRSTRT